MSTKTRWTLYVDESGDFDSLDAAVTVGGMLVDDAPGTSPASVAAGLCRALPWIRWPLHAGNLDQVAYVAGGTADERYFAGLEAMLDRVVAVLERREGTHRVGLARDVRDSRIGVRRPLMPQDVGSAIRRLLSDRASPVSLLAEGVADYDARVSVEFVLADFLANRARRTLDQLGSTLAEAEGARSGDLGAPARSGQPPRSHLAAAGEALRFIRDPAPRPLAWAPPRRRWAVEQALEWASRG